MLSPRITSALAAATILVGCAPDSAPTDGDDPIALAGGKADQINGQDDPSGLLSNAERRLSEIVTAADVGQSFGVDEDKIPYPDTYWPMVDDGIAVEWLEKSGAKCDLRNECDDPQASPLEKWVSVTAPGSVDEALKWEVTNHGTDVPNVADWFGHCPGWVATAMLHEPIPGPVHVRSNGFNLETCEPGEEGCTTFELGDVNALGAEAHEGAQSRFIGARCDTDPADIERDEFGRIVRNGTGCKGLNAGALLIVVGNRLKIEKKPFAIDAQNEFTTEQIWNQPAFRYTVNRFEELSESEAANLVATGGESDTGEMDEYQFNANADGFALIDFTLSWVTETPGPNLVPVSGGSSFKTTRMVAVIELDGAVGDPSTEIIGGEYLDDPAVGADRLRVAPFAWIALDAGPDFRHNPFVRASQVKQLIKLAQENGGNTGGGGGGGGGNTSCAQDECAEGGRLEASCSSCATSVCAADAFCCSSSWDNLCVDQAEQLCGC